MIFSDTGYFIGLIEPSDSLHARALVWTRANNELICTTDYAVVEVLNYFSKPSSRAKAHGLLSQLRADSNFEIVPASPTLFEAGLRLHAARPDKEWSLTDCLSFALMRERGVTRALAHDHHFEQAGFEPLLRREPT